MQTTGWEVEKALESSCRTFIASADVLTASRAHAQIELERVTLVSSRGWIESAECSMLMKSS
jgi:hypothetical protein